MSATGPFSEADSTGEVPLTVGGVVFRVEECPEFLPIGGLEQMKAVHDNIGGSRIIQVLGSKPKDVAFEGTFWDDQIDTRVQALRAYAASGVTVPITYGGEQYEGIVDDFLPTYHSPVRCAYHLSLCISRSTNGAFTSAPAPSADDVVHSITADFDSQNAALQTSDPAGAAAMQQAFVNMDYALASAGPLAQLTAAQLSSVTNAVAAAQQAIQAYIAAADQTTQSYINASRMLAMTAMLSANLQRAQSSSTIKPRWGASLYDVAVVNYRDITKAFDIVDANPGVLTPALSRYVGTTIALPSLPVKS